MSFPGSESQPGAEQPVARDNDDRLAVPRWLLDAGAAVALVAALGVVVWLDRPGAEARTGTEAAPVDGVEVVVDEDPASLGIDQPLRLAVTPPEYDDMGKLLDTLGTGYRYTTIEFDDLLDPVILDRYDVVFLTCGGVPRQWLSHRLRDGQRGSGGVYRARPAVLRTLRNTLRDFVAEGGTLYASDWQFNLIRVAFPEFVDEAAIASGAEQTVEAEVVDPALRRVIGSTIPLRFDKPSWRPAAFAGEVVNVLLRGSYKTVDDRELSGPLLVVIPWEAGTIIFTSFHNEAQNSDIELELLRYLVFTTVTADLQADVKRMLVRGGFSPVERSLLSTSAANQSIEQTYECTRMVDLQFVLGFKDQGATLTLRVRGPGGREFEKSGSSTITIDVADAAPGTWRYWVLPQKVPYANFPFTVTVGQEQ